MKQILTRIVLSALLAGTALAQSQLAPPTSASLATTESSSGPIRFDLDFKGGSIRALIDAIGAARGKPVNVYLPQEAESIAIAPFRVSSVTLKEVLNAISGWSAVKRAGNVREKSFHYAFSSGVDSSDGAIWSVRIENLNPEPEPVCRVYSLSPHLESGLSVDDISTAIRTAWKMMNYAPSTVNLSYHRETKLLIAVAPEPELQAIEQVLNALPKGPSGRKASVAASPESPKPSASKL